MKAHRCSLLLLTVSAFFGFSRDLRAAVAAYDLSAGFSAASNPNGPWAYGWKARLAGAFTLLTVPHISIADNGVRVPSWQLTSGEAPVVYVNNTTSTATAGGGLAVLPPGTMWFGPGQNGRPENLGVIRFTVPAGGTGDYEVKVAVTPVYNNGVSPQGDSDFHVLKNGVELFGENLAPTASTGYTNTVSLSQGDTVEFAIGRGPDGDEYGSVRKIAGSLTATTVTSPPSTNCASPVRGLAVWLPLETDARDVVSGGQGVVRGNPVFTTGKVAQGLRFDGVDDTVRLPATVAMDIGAGPGVTLEMWINPAELGSPAALLEWSTSTGPEPGLHFYTSVNGPGSLFANLIDTDVVAHHISSDPGVLSTGVFQHVALTYDRFSGLARLYVNATQVGQASFGNLRLDTRPDLWLGVRILNGPAYRFAGVMDEVSLYNRALAEAEIQAIYTASAAGKCGLTHTPPPPPPAGAYDLAGGFSATSNPNGPWAYGWKGTLAGAFTALTVPYVSSADGGQSVPSWQLTSFQTPAVYKNTTGETVTSGGGAATYPPGTVWYFPGENGRPENLGVIRFTVPAGGAGNYDVRVAVAPVYKGSPQGDTDFHVVRNGRELFGRGLAVGARTGYTNIVALGEGDTVDFAIGRGADGNQYGSGLRIAGSLTVTTNTPPPPPPGTGLVVPNELANADEAFGSGNLFNAAYRSQQVYGAGEFGSVTGPILITELRYRPDYYYGWAFTTTVANIQFNLSTTARMPDGLSSTFADNVGEDDTMVFSGPLSLSSSFSGPASGPKVFDIIVPLSRGFVYHPAAGNLLVEIRNFSGSSASLLSGQGVTGDHASRVGGDVNSASGTPDTGADALLIVYAPTDGPVPPPLSPSRLRVVSVASPPTSVASVPIEIVARGDENAFSFSLDFNPSLLSFRSASAAGLAGATLIVNSNDAGAGRVGIVLALPASIALPPGTQELMRVEFQTGLTTGAAPVTFGSTPVSLQVADAFARPVPAVYAPGTVLITSAGFEADVVPRPAGDRAIEVIDLVQIARFAANLDTPAAGEFSRIDCAPRATRGNGVISAADVVQAGRYMTGRDPLTPAGGPMAPVGGFAGFQPAGDSPRKVGVANGSAAPSAVFTLPVLLEAQGDENALGLSIAYDPAKMTFLGAAIGADAASASLNVNAIQKGSGKLGFVLALSAGQTFSVGTKEVMRLSFVAAENATGSGAVSIGDEPVLRELVGAGAESQAASFVAGTVSFGVVTLPGPHLSFTRSGETLLLAWPASVVGFELEGTAGPLGTRWTPISGFTLGEQKMALVPINGGQRYFRLKKP